MNFKPSENLTDTQVQSGLRYIIKESLAGEAMVNLTGGTFMVAMALHLGASNFQIGLLAGLPVLTNIFQFLSIWLVQRYNNRKGVAVIASFWARFPMLSAIALPFMFSASASLQLLIGILFLHYVFGSIAGASWNSWMKDLVPEKILGEYFSQRTKLVTIMSAVMGLFMSFFIDFVKAKYPEYLTNTYYALFILGAIIGLVGVYWLAQAPEPKQIEMDDKFFKQFKQPLKDSNFMKFIAFNSFWTFAVNLATPFFSVFMMKTIGLPLSYIMGLTILAQIANILSIKMWGRFTDRYSNKTIIHICAPIYVACILAWAYAALPSQLIYNMLILIAISIVSGISTGGINLAIGNMGMKLAPRREAMAYMSVLNMIVSLFAAIAPLTGGLMADYFANHQLIWDLQWKSAAGMHTIPVIALHGWNFLFVIGGLLSLVSLRMLSSIKEQGEVNKDKVVTYMKMRLSRSISKTVRYNTIRDGVRYSGQYPTRLSKRVQHLFKQD